jgi:hypothetical protein
MAIAIPIQEHLLMAGFKGLKSGGTRRSRQLHLSDVDATLDQLPKNQQPIVFNVVAVFFRK